MCVYGWDNFAPDHSSTLYAIDTNLNETIWSISKCDPTSIPAIANGIVYINAINAPRSRQSDGFLAVNITNGEIIWNVTQGVNGMQSPVIANGLIYMIQINKLTAFNGTGSFLWRFNQNITSAPTILDRKGFVGGNNFVYAIDATFGNLLWNYTTNSPILAAPNGINGVLFAGNIFALNMTTGALIWNFAAGNLVRSSPTIANNLLLVGVKNSRLFAFPIEELPVSSTSPLPSSTFVPTTSETSRETPTSRVMTTTRSTSRSMTSSASTPGGSSGIETSRTSGSTVSTSNGSTKTPLPQTSMAVSNSSNPQISTTTSAGTTSAPATAPPDDRKTRILIVVIVSSIFSIGFGVICGIGFFLKKRKASDAKSPLLQSTAL